MKKVDKLIEMMGAMTTEGSDRALYFLLKENRVKLPKLDDYFHKAFRQTDVTGSPHIDMAIWHLINKSRLFWDLFNQVAGVNQ